MAVTGAFIVLATFAGDNAGCRRCLAAGVRKNRMSRHSSLCIREPRFSCNIARLRRKHGGTGFCLPTRAMTDREAGPTGDEPTRIKRSPGRQAEACSTGAHGFSLAVGSVENFCGIGAELVGSFGKTRCGV